MDGLASLCLFSIFSAAYTDELILEIAVKDGRSKLRNV